MASGGIRGFGVGTASPAMITKNPFGGPDNLSETMLGLIQSFLVGQEKQKQQSEEQMLAQLLGSGGQGEDFDPQAATEQLLSNPNVGIKNKMLGLKALESRRAIAEPYKTPETKRIKVDFWDDKGVKRSVMVPEQAYNDFTDRAVTAGYSLTDPGQEKWETKQAILKGKPVFAQISDKGNTRLLDANNLEPVMQGMKFSIDKDGNIVFEQGNGVGMGQVPPGNTPLGKGATDAVQKDIIALEDQAAKLKRITTSFDPYMLTVKGKGEAWFLDLKDRLTGVGGIEGLNPDQQKYVQDFSQFGQNAATNANKTINELSGAAVSPWEASRLYLEVPNFDKGFFAGDGPRVFKSKLDNVTEAVDLAIARKKYYLKNGFTPAEQKRRMESNEKSGKPFADFKEEVNRRGADIARAYKKSNPNAKDDEVRQAVAKEIKKEFGL